MLQTTIIVGLGNPGPEYVWTRHNLGFLVTQRLAEKHNVVFKKSLLSKGKLAKIVFSDRHMYLYQPLTFMNNSGVAVRKLLDQKKCDLDQCLIVCDDFHLQFGQLRLRSSGSDGGHNGLASVISHCRTQDIPRLRCGIGDPGRRDLVDFVLSDFKKDEKKHLDDFIEAACCCCCDWLELGLPKAMEKYNKKDPWV